MSRKGLSADEPFSLLAFLPLIFLFITLKFEVKPIIYYGFFYVNMHSSYRLYICCPFLSIYRCRNIVIVFIYCYNNLKDSNYNNLKYSDDEQGVDFMSGLKKVNTVDAIIEAMLNKIKAGEYNPGERIPSEKVLAKEFQVSRTSLREAFKKLELMGTITIRQGDGTYLNENSHDNSRDKIIETWLRSSFTIGDNNLMDYLEAREMIEIKAAGLAAKRVTPEDIEKISHILSALSALDTSDISQYSKLDFEFHQAVIYAAHNTFISKLWDLLSPLIAEQQARSNYITGVTSNASQTHKLLFDAIVNKKSKNAEKIMAEHLSLIPGRLFTEATKMFTEENT